MNAPRNRTVTTIWELQVVVYIGQEYTMTLYTAGCTPNVNHVSSPQWTLGYHIHIHL